MRGLAEVPALQLSLEGFVMKDSRLKRVSTGLPALDRVLGGGLVKGSTTLLAGHPGVGKTTLTLQVLAAIGQRCLYATGEETLGHVKARTRRIGVVSDQICLLAEGRLGKILAQARSMRAQAIVIDSIQTLICEHVRGRRGLPAQLRTCMKLLIDYAKTTDTTLWLVNYLTNRGCIAGPRTIEHDVDVVLRLDQKDAVRILSCPSKNRFGPTNVVGHLELTTKGLIEADKEVSSLRLASTGGPAPGVR